MPGLDDLLNTHGKQIASESKEFKGALSNEVPRDPVRRPWNGLEEGVEFAESKVTEKSILRPGSWDSIWLALTKHYRLVLVMLVVSLVSLVGLAQLEPSIYSSNLHLYAPEKSDTISSRLMLFTNRVEFASFPVDNKIPLALIARRLKLAPAKAWVVDQYKKRPHENPVAINPDTVSAETFYAEGSELMVISGYGNDPQIAADVTNLYWDYLEDEVQKMQSAHMAKVNQWIELTTVSLNQRMTALAVELAQVSAIHPVEAKAQVHAKLAESYADLEMKRLKLAKERDEFRSALQNSPSENIWLVSNPDIQEMKQIDEALKKQNAESPNPEIAAKRTELFNKAVEFARGQVPEKSREISSIQDQTLKLKAQLNIYQGDDSMSAQGSRLKELLRQQAEYQVQADELERLKTQLTVESAMTHSRLHPIQAALADPGSLRPRPVLKYAVCFLMAMLLSFLLLVWLERGTRILQPQSDARRRTPMSPENNPAPHRAAERGLEL